MRFARTLVLVASLAVPLWVSAFTVPFVGSPFSRMTVFPFEGPPTPAVSSQSAAATTAPHPGVTDICYSVSIKEVNGTHVETYSEHPDDGCETLRKKYATDKAACQNGSFRDVVGDYSYTDYAGKVYQGNRCDHLPGSPSSVPTIPASVAGITPEMMNTISDPSSADGQAKMVEMYKSICVDGTCVPEDAAKTIVESDPQKAHDLLQAMSTGDRGQAEEINKEFHLDQNAIEENMNQIESPGDAPSASDQPAKGERSSVCGFSGIADKMMLPESGCGENNGKGRNQGPLQFSCETWSSYANETGHAEWSDCSNRMDPQKSALVTNEMGGKYESRYSARCTAAGVSMDSCNMAIHAWGEPQFKKMLNTLETNPSAAATSWCGGDTCANKAYLNKYNPDGTVKGVFASLDQFMACGWSCNSSGVVTPGKYLGSTDSAGLSGPAVAKSAVGIGTNADPYQYPASPVSQASNPFGTNSMQQMQQLMMLQNMMASMSQRQAAVQQEAARQQAKQAPPPPTLSLTARPQMVKRGEPIAVSWTTSGTSQSTLCTVTQNSFLLEKGNVGSQTFPTSTSTPNSIVFTLACADEGGKPVPPQSVTVIVQ